MATQRTRLSPDERRVQLLDLGVQLLATRSLDELSIDLLADEGDISRGLLYHYFGNKQGFHEAVVRHAVAHLIERTAPPTTGDAAERLLASMSAYADYVVDNYQGYVSLVRGAAGGNETLRQIYDETRGVLIGRIFDEDVAGLLPDTDAARLLARSWGAMAEEMVVTWADEPGKVSHDQLVAMLASSLPAMAAALPIYEEP